MINNEIKQYEINELRESLQNCRDFLSMKQMEVESLQKEIKKLKLELQQLKGENV